MYHMTSYVTDVDFISDHFPAFWQAWLNIFIKSQAMKTRVE